MQKFIKPVVSILIALFLGWLAIRDVSLDVFVDSIVNINWLLCLFAIPVYILCLYLRSFRWAYILGPMVKIGNYPLFAYSLVGMLVNNVIPARAGEFYRAYLCSDRHPIKYSSSLAIVLVDRILDCIILVGFLGFVIFLHEFDNSLMNQILFYSAILFVCAIFAVIVTAFFPRFIKNISSKIISILPKSTSTKLEEFSDQFIEGVTVLRSVKRIGWSLFLTLLSWLAEALFYWLMFIAMGFDASISWSLLTIPVISFVLLVATVPANMGVYHFAVVSSLALFGVDQSAALAAAVIVHSAELLVEIGLGAFYMIRLNLNFSGNATSR